MGCEPKTLQDLAGCSNHWRLYREQRLSVSSYENCITQEGIQIQISRRGLDIK